MELMIAVPEQKPLRIKNFEELKTDLKNHLLKYQGLVYNCDSQLQEAKTDRANLRRLREAIDNRRKEIKAQIMEDYTANFEPKVRELLALVDEPIGLIDAQVKSYEEEKKEAKKNAIKAIWKENAADLGALVPFEKIFNEKWLNGGSSLKGIESTIIGRVWQINNDLAVLDKLESKYKEQAKTFYLSDLDLSAALSEEQRLREMADKIAAYNAQKKTGAEAPAPQRGEEAEQEELQQIDFRVWVTPEQKAKVRAFFIDNKIKYGKVPSK